VLDADLPRADKALVERFGHEAMDFRDLGLGRAKDPATARCALEHEAVLLTGDFGFAVIRNCPPRPLPWSGCPGVTPGCRRAVHFGLHRRCPRPGARGSQTARTAGDCVRRAHPASTGVRHGRREGGDSTPLPETHPHARMKATVVRPMGIQRAAGPDGLGLGPTLELGAWSLELPLTSTPRSAPPPPPSAPPASGDTTTTAVRP